MALVVDADDVWAGGGWVEAALAGSDADVVAASKWVEGVRRRLEADQAVLLAEVARRGIYVDDGHRSMVEWGRAEHRWSSREARARRDLSVLCREEPLVLAALRAGTLGVVQAHLLARARQAPRCGGHLGGFVAMLIERAGRESAAEFEQTLGMWRRLVDVDGPEPGCSDHRRSLSLQRDRFGFVLRVRGGTLDGAELARVLDRYSDGEWQREHADTAAGAAAGVARTAGQRRYDAFTEMVSDLTRGAASGEPGEPTVHLVTDLATFAETCERLFGPPAGAPQQPGDPAELLRRRCHTADGSPVAPSEVVLAAIRGRVRLVLTDHRGVVLHMGRVTRLFRGAARDAVLLAATRCTHPGCELVRLQADHTVPFSAGSPTDVLNGNPACGHHNRWRFTAGARVFVDDQGCWRTLRHDGTEIGAPDHFDHPDHHHERPP